jgi:hypothetical protein
MEEAAFFSSPGYRNAQDLLSDLSSIRSAELLDQVFGLGAADRFNGSALFTETDPLGSVGISILSDEQLQGHPGAFTSSFLDGSPEILLNGSWLRSASVDAVTGVILEEFGHAIDWAVNGDRDTSGDEGLWFSHRLLATHGINYSTYGRPDGDHGTLQLGSISIGVEFATTAGFTTTGISAASWSSATSGLSNNGSVTTASAPASITVIGSNAGSTGPEAVDYSTNSIITAPGFAVYDWSYTNNDPDLTSDSFGTLINGTTYSVLSSSARASQSKPGQLTSFFTTPTSFGFRALSNDGVNGNIVADISNFQFKRISEAYYVRFNNLFAAVNDGANADAGALISSNVWILPDDPTTDVDFRTNFASNGSGATKRVWLITDNLNGGEPLELFLTNGVDTVGSATKDRWIFNTLSDGSGTSYIASSGSDTTASNDTSLNLPRVGAIALSDLDDLRAEQNDTIPPEVSSVSISDWRLKSGDTTMLTIVFSEEVMGLDDTSFASIVQFPNLTKSGSLTTADNITFTVLLTPNASAEDHSNIISVDASQLTDLVGNVGSNTAGRFSGNYTVDTTPPALTGIYFHLTGGTSASALTRPILYGEIPYLYFQLREPVYNLRLQDLDVTGGTVTNLEVCDNTGAAAVGTEETSTLYRARFTPSPIISNSIPVWAKLKSFSDRAEATIDGYPSYLAAANSTGNINIPTTSSAANLRFSIDNSRPFATFRTPPTALSRGALRAIQLDMSEEVRSSGLGRFGTNCFQVSGGGYVASVKQLSKTRWEILLVAPRYAGDYTLSIIPGSFYDVNGNRSIANKQFLDRVRFRVA